MYLCSCPLFQDSILGSLHLPLILTIILTSFPDYSNHPICMAWANVCFTLLPLSSKAAKTTTLITARGSKEFFDPKKIKPTSGQIAKCSTLLWKSLKNYGMTPSLSVDSNPIQPNRNVSLFTWFYTTTFDLFSCTWPLKRLPSQNSPIGWDQLFQVIGCTWKVTLKQPG